nr:MAG TPA: hypothetical protein [Bacteriophage sp.]
MANYGGNSFPQGTAEAHAERLPIWNYVDHTKLVGVAVLPSTTYPVDTRWPLGTPVQLSTDGSAPKIGSAATTPDGLLLADVVMDAGGCTLTIVRAGSIRVNLMEASVTTAQRGKLPLIDFDEDYYETVS